MNVKVCLDVCIHTSSSWRLHILTIYSLLLAAYFNHLSINFSYWFWSFVHYFYLTMSTVSIACSYLFQWFIHYFKYFCFLAFMLSACGIQMLQQRVYFLHLNFSWMKLVELLHYLSTYTLGNCGSACLGDQLGLTDWNNSGCWRPERTEHVFIKNRKICRRSTFWIGIKKKKRL